jgi:hypothetical protein
MAKKKRFCNLPRIPGLEKCGVHCHGGTVGATGAARVPCTVDPSHTVFAHQLVAHAKVCNATRLARALEAQPYFRMGANSGICGAKAAAAAGLGAVEATAAAGAAAGAVTTAAAGTASGAEAMSAGSARAAGAGAATTRVLPEDPMDDMSLLAKIEALYAQHCGGAGDGSLIAESSGHPRLSTDGIISNSNSSSSSSSSSDSSSGGIALRFERAAELELYLAASTSSEGAINRKAAHRHLLQQASIVASLKRVSVYGAYVRAHTHAFTLFSTAFSPNAHPSP